MVCGTKGPAVLSLSAGIEAEGSMVLEEGDRNDSLRGRTVEIIAKNQIVVVQPSYPQN